MCPVPFYLGSPLMSFDPHDLLSTRIASKSQALSREKAGIEDISTIVHALADGIAPDANCALIGEGVINPGLISDIENRLETKLFVPEEHRLVTALGAALIAEDTVNQRGGSTGQ